MGKLTLLLTAGASRRRRTDLRTLGPLFARRSADTRRQDGDVDLASGRVNSRLLQRFTVQPYNTHPATIYLIMSDLPFRIIRI